MDPQLQLCREELEAAPRLGTRTIQTDPLLTSGQATVDEQEEGGKRGMDSVEESRSFI